MKLAALILAAAALAPAPIALSAAAHPANLKVEGVPEIPAAIKAATAPYLETRSARFQGWNPARRSILISTRFGETPQLHEVLTPGGARRQLTFQPEPVSAGGYDPVRGDLLIGAQDVGGGERYQIYRFDGGRRTLLTDGESRNTDVVFTKDGARVGYASTRRNGRSADLWMMDPRAPGSERMVLETTAPGWRFLDFAPDGRTAVVQQYRTSTDGPIHLLDMTTGALQPLTPDDAKVGVGGAEFGADGTLYVLTDQGSDVQRLVRLDPVTRTVRPLSSEASWEVEAFDVAPDGSFLAYVVNEAGLGRLKVLDLKAGKASAVDLPAGVISDLQISPWGEIGFTLNSTHAPGDIYSVAARTGEVRRWTFSEAGGLDTSGFASPELVTLRSFDGLPISGFLYRPDPRRFPGKRPVLFSIHGGPAAQSRPGFLGRDNYLIEELGFAVFQPNVRGSTGYGKRFVAADDGLRREDSLKDIGTFLAHLARDPNLDADRVALLGGSYSGYLVLGGLIAYGDRVRAGISQSGISSFTSFLERTGAYRRDLRRAEYGDERQPEVRAFLDRISPLAGASRITDPILIAGGANDPRVPVSEAEQIVAAVRANGGTAWSLVASDEGHGFSRKANRDYYFWSLVQFLRAHLLGVAS